MSREWDRESYAGDWPSLKPVGLILALVVAVASAVGIEALRYKYQWTFTQRFYLARYIQTGLAGTLRKQGYYMMLAVVDRRGLHRIAFADELAPATLSNGERGERLTRAALSRGAVRLEWERGYYDNVQLHARSGNGFLKTNPGGT